jgi:hypothetical protein
MCTPNYTFLISQLETSDMSKLYEAFGSFRARNQVQADYEQSTDLWAIFPVSLGLSRALQLPQLASSKGKRAVAQAKDNK